MFYDMSHCVQARFSDYRISSRYKCVLIIMIAKATLSIADKWITRIKLNILLMIVVLENAL